MMSNNFVELKGSVFKKFEINNLFQISCSGEWIHAHNREREIHTQIQVHSCTHAISVFRYQGTIPLLSSSISGDNTKP